MIRSRTVAALLACTFLLSVATPAVAEEKPPKGSVGVPQGPIYNPQTDSYFELRTDNFTQTPDGHNNAAWSYAHRRAGGLSYKGRPGRLAIVKDLETLQWVRDNFRINEFAWIGMRFFCQFRKLVWVTGEVQPLRSPGMWAPQWHRSNVRCTTNRMQYMPVYLSAESDGPVSWQASGIAKYGTNYLVEYPASPAATETNASAE